MMIAVMMKEMVDNSKNDNDYRRNAFRIPALPKRRRRSSHEGRISGWSGKGNRSSWSVGDGKLEVKLVREAGQVSEDTFVSFWNRIQVEI